MPAVNKLALSLPLAACVFVLAIGCSSPPKATVPALTPQNASTLLQYNTKAQNWITYVKKQNATCGYQLNLPDQTTQPATIDLSHIVVCGGRPSPMEFDASVSFEYDKSAQKWAITRFSS